MCVHGMLNLKKGTTAAESSELGDRNTTMNSNAVEENIKRTMAKAMLDALQARLGVVDFRVRIDPANLASQGLFEKLGAIPNGISGFILSSEEEIKQCEDASLYLIDDVLSAVAKKFSIEPRKLLSHALEYKLHWG